MYEQMQVGAAEGHSGGQFADADFDRLDDQGQLCAVEIRTLLNGGWRDDQGVDLSRILADATVVAPAEAHEHVCDGGDAYYPGGRPDGAQACRQLDELELARLQRGCSLASAVLNGGVDWRTLPVIE